MKPSALCPSLALLLALSACSSGHNVQGSGGGTARAANAPANAAGAEVTATDASQLREKAAGVLTAIAATPSRDPAASALRANAFEGLLTMPGRLEPILRTALTDDSVGIRSVAAMAAGKAKLRGLNDAVRPLVDDQSPIVRASAIYALTRNGENADQSLLAGMLLGSDVQQRAHAAFILGELGNTSAVPLLLAAAAKPSTGGSSVRDRLMRLQIAEALVKLGKKDAIDEVRAALYPSQPEDLEATALAVQIIGQVRDVDSSPQLQNMIADTFNSSNPMPIEVRLAAAADLARFGNARAAGFAEQYLVGQTAPIRAQAAAVIGETRNARHLPTLAPLLADADEQVRVTAAAAVVKITDAR